MGLDVERLLGVVLQDLVDDFGDRVLRQVVELAGVGTVCYRRPVYDRLLTVSRKPRLSFRFRAGRSWTFTAVSQPGLRLHDLVVAPSARFRGGLAQDCRQPNCYEFP